MTVTVGGQPVTAAPFTLKMEAGKDVFNPQKKFTRDGPWRSLGYLFVPVERPDDALHFTFWVSTSELPAGMARPKCTLHLVRGSQEVAVSDTAVVISSEDWMSFSKRLLLPAGAGKTRGPDLTLAALTKSDGDYSLVLKADGTPFKTYAVRVKGGQLQRLERCSLETKPHTDFISPRLVDTSSGTGSRYRQLDAYLGQDEREIAAPTRLLLAV